MKSRTDADCNSTLIVLGAPNGAGFMYCPVLRQALLLVMPDGYLCRQQPGALRYMVAFKDPARAVKWCLMLQVDDQCCHWHHTHRWPVAKDSHHSHWPSGAVGTAHTFGVCITGWSTRCISVSLWSAGHVWAPWFVKAVPGHSWDIAGAVQGNIISCFHTCWCFHATAVTGSHEEHPMAK